MQRRRSTTARFATTLAIGALVALSAGALAQSRGSAPAQVTDLEAEAEDVGIFVTWDHPYPIEMRDQWPEEEDPALFHVYRQVEDGDWERIATMNARTSEDHLDENVEPLVTYTYAVTYDDGVESCDPGFCDEQVSVTYPPGSDFRPPSSPPPVCSDALTAQAQDDGSVLLAWEPANEEHNSVAFYRVLRDGEAIAEVDGTSYVDASAEGGETYTYRVEAHGHAAGSGTVFSGCGTAEVTAVPFFGAPLLGALALAGSVGAYAWSRRRS